MAKNNRQRTGQSSTTSVDTQLSSETNKEEEEAICQRRSPKHQQQAEERQPRETKEEFSPGEEGTSGGKDGTDGRKEAESKHEGTDGGKKVQENHGVHQVRRRNRDDDPSGRTISNSHVRTGADPSDEPCVHPCGPRARGSLRKQSPSRATNNGNLVRRLAFS